MAATKSTLFKATDYLHPKHWFLWIAFALMRLITVFPYSVHLSAGRFIGRLMQRLAGKREKIVDINLKLCFPQKTIEQRNRIKTTNYENLGISLFELAMCWWWKADRLKPLVEVRGLEHIENCLANKQPVILLSGHFTSLEIGARLLALFLPFQVMYRTQKNSFFDSLLFSKRQDYLVDVISRKNTRRMIKGIRNLLPTWYAPDQDFSRERNVFAPFFNVQTATITASSRLAEAGKAVMLPYYPERKADGSGYILWIKPPLENFPCGDDLQDATAINASIEQFARKNPDQYMWVHQRFKTRPTGEADIY